MPELLDEKALRRTDGWLGGNEAVLADGQTWTIAVPDRVFVLDESAEDGFKTISRFGGAVDEEFDRLWKAYEDAEDGADIVRSTLRVMLKMLRLNYPALTAEQAAPLIPVSFRTDRPDPIREAFMSAGRGQTAEKPSAVGSPLL